MLKKRVEAVEKELLEDEDIQIQIAIVKSKDEDPATREVIIIGGKKPFRGTTGMKHKAHQGRSGAYRWGNLKGLDS